MFIRHVWKRSFSMIFALIAMLALVAFAATPKVKADTQVNKDPIILVTGFGGWGRNELFGYKYFGGFDDIQQVLRNEGYTVYTLSPSPFASNWDRACQLYAMIKGGTVDYGQANSTEYGTARYGKTYPGVYPEWDSTHKVQLVGHSMGGQTIRMLTQLLEQGYPAEKALPDHSSLFDGGKHWVDSVTTISTPNDGTTLATGITHLLPMAQQLVASVAALAGNSTDPVYSFGLGMWGLQRQPGQSFQSYEQQVFNSNIWTSTKNISSYDLSPQGAAAINSWVHAQPDVYYFSWSTEKTHESWLTGHQVADWSMTPLLWPTADFMGQYTNSIANSSWWENDGVVNTISENGPKLDSTDNIVNYNGTPQIGVWNFMGVLPYDHLQVVGQDFYNMNSFYSNLANQLSQLPN